MRAVPLAAAVLILASGAAAAAPVGVVGDPLDRAAWVAEPAVYEIEAIYPPGDDTRRRKGLAFGVSTTGHLLAANHVIANNARRAARIVVRRPGTSAVTWSARVVKTDPDNDIALLRIDEPGAPALLLDARVGGGVATFGLGNDGLVVRKGSVGATGPVGPPVDGVVTRVEVDIQRGDSGAPVVGENGRVQGMVTGFFDGTDSGFMKAAPALETFVRNAGVKNAEGAPTVAFRRGVAALGRLDADDAHAWFRKARAAYPNHPTVDGALADARVLAASGFRMEDVPRDQGFLVMAAVVFGAIAVCFGGALVSRRPRRYGGMR